MTTPGGVPNLPQGALTLANLESTLQDTSGTAMKGRAVERFPSIFDGSTGLSPASAITPFGILTKIWAGVNSLIANADPADVQGPEDLPPLVLEFIEGLPLIGQFVTLVEAILGVYDGDDASLLTVQAIFAPLRAIVGAFGGIDLSDPGSILKAIESPIQALMDALKSGATGESSTGNNPLSLLVGILGQAGKLPANLVALLTGHKATQATNQAQIDALQTGGFVHDFAKGVTGWSNLLGTLTKSALGPFVQPSTVTVAYRSSGLTVDAYGVHLSVDPSMQGFSWIGLCATSTGSNWAGLVLYRGFDGDALWLVTGSSPTLMVVQKFVDYTGDNRLTGITGLDLKTDGVNTFSVLCNGDPVPQLDWMDTGGIIGHLAANRGVILGANGTDRSDNGFRGPAPMKVVTYAA